MAENNNVQKQKAVTFEALEEASKLLATKEEVEEKIADAVATCANITFASTEEVLALFQKKAPETETTPETPEAGA